MKNSVKLILFIFLAGSYAASAQTNFYLDGAGRVITKNDKLSGETVDKSYVDESTGDTSNVANKGLSGYQLFDLGLHLERKKSFHATTILRAKNKFGYFYGQGVDLDWRQITIEGVIGKGVKYEIGDIYLELSPYTLYNPDAPLQNYEAEPFKERREIQEYENFVKGNSWRLQGANFYSTLLFDKGIEKLYLQGFATRTQPFNNIGQNDRIMFGATAKAIQSEKFNLGVNYAGVSDVTISTSEQVYRTFVPTGDISYNNDFGTGVKFGFDAEGGMSKYYLEEVRDDLTPTIDESGQFFEAALSGTHKASDFKLTALYRKVDEKFSSPGAQTRRYNDNYANTLFSEITYDMGDPNGVYALGARPQSLFDRYSEEGVYNKGLSTVNLQNYNPIYGNINPYGVATPNRDGFQVKLEREGDKKAYNLSVSYESAKEVKSVLADERRNFSAIRAGAKINLHEIFEWKKSFELTGAYNTESTIRNGDSTGIDLSTSTIDLGFNIEVLDNLSLIYGTKMFSAKGNERMDFNNGFNTEYDQTNNVQMMGLKFRLSPKAFISGYYNISDVTNNLTLENTGTIQSPSYKINELFLNFTLKF